MKKSKDLHPRSLYPAKLSFRMVEQIKCFLDEVKLKEFISTKPLLHGMLKGLKIKKEDYEPEKGNKFTTINN